MWIKPKEIRETRLLMSQMRSGDPTVAGRAREVLKKRFAADVPEGHRGLPPPAIIHSMISSSIQALDATAFGRMVAHVEHGGWTEAAKGSFRLIKVDVSGPRALLHGRATLPIQVPVATGTADGQFRVPFVLDCIAAPDCRDRILAAVRDPNQALAKLGEMTDVSKFVADNPDVAADLETQAEFIPPGSYANFIATGIAFAMAGRLALETGGSSVQTLLAAQPVEIFPKTPTARLVDRVFALASHGPLARLAQERFGDAIHKLTRSLAGS
jgi:hypothetical protein